MGIITSCLLIWTFGGNNQETSFPLGDSVKGKALVVGVKLGMSPRVADLIFGPPDSKSCFMSGPPGYVYDWPVDCYYSRYGVVVYFRSSQFRSGNGTMIEPERVHGGIQ